MKKLSLIIYFIFLFFSWATAQENTFPIPPQKGPGSQNYLHQEVIQYDFAKKADGYWLFEPASPRPDSAKVVVFTHGYGGYNPMIYGEWIRHLVKNGNIVIFPRYQKNVYFPRPRKFSKNVSQAIRDAIAEMKKSKRIFPKTDQLALVGHSYGGVVSADLAVNFEKHNIPKPVAVLLCSPGTGPLKGGVLDSYKGIPEDVKLVVMVSENDYVVGEKFGQKVFETAIHVKSRNYIRQLRDNSAEPPHRAGHNECYAIDPVFDNGKRNFTTRRALRVGSINNIDFYGYWKIFDSMLACSREGEHCEYAFGDTPEQRFLGRDRNGKPIRELEIILPNGQNPPSISSQ